MFGVLLLLKHQFGVTWGDVTVICHSLYCMHLWKYMCIYTGYYRPQRSAKVPHSHIFRFFAQLKVKKPGQTDHRCVRVLDFCLLSIGAYLSWVNFQVPLCKATVNSACKQPLWSRDPQKCFSQSLSKSIFAPLFSCHQNDTSRSKNDRRKCGKHSWISLIWRPPGPISLPVALGGICATWALQLKEKREVDSWIPGFLRD